MLSAIPNAHFLAPYSRYWLVWLKGTGREHRVRHATHERLGPIIRIGPNEVSVNCIENGVQSIYGGGFEKAAWYLNFQNYGSVGGVHVKVFTFVLSRTAVNHSCLRWGQTNLIPREKTHDHPRLLQVIYSKLAGVERNHPYYAFRAIASSDA